MRKESKKVQELLAGKDRGKRKQGNINVEAKGERQLNAVGKPNSTEVTPCMRRHFQAVSYWYGHVSKGFLYEFLALK